MKQFVFTSSLITLSVITIAVLSTPVVFADANWTCQDGGSTYSSQSFCQSQCSTTCTCSGSDCTSTSGGNRFAQGAPYPHGVTPPAGGPINDVSSFLYILVSLIQFAEAVFWILTVGFGLYGAYLYLFAAGNSEQAAKARKVFIYAAIAALLAIVAYGIPGIVNSFIFGF